MFERWLGRIREQVSGDRALADVREIARHHRIQASPGYDDAVRWLVGAIAAAGLAGEIDEAPGDGRTRYLGMPMPEGWECRSARAALVSGAGRETLADFEREPLSLIQRSAPARGTFEVVALEGDGDGCDAPQDLTNRVVLASAPVQRVHARAVLGRGAAGILYDGRRLLPPVRTPDDDRDSLAYASFWWQGDEPRGWGFVASPARGAALRERLARGESVSLEAEIDTRRGPRPIPLVSVCLPGEWPGEILLTAHLCHPRPGANDNGSGVAASLEAARVLAALAASGDLPRARRSIRVLWMPEFTGTYAWIGRDAARAARTVAALNLDMVGEDQPACGSTQLIERSPHFAASFADELLARIRHAAQEWVGGYSGPGHYSLVRLAEVPYGGGSDHAVWSDPAVGVPCPMLIQWPDRYYHSNLDGPERCDPASLAHAARIAATYAASLACAGEEEVRGLLASTARAARRRMLQALDGADPAGGARAERLRGELALASVQRLVQLEPPGSAMARALALALPDAVEDLEGFWEAEIEPALADALRGAPLRGPGARVPVRTAGLALLPFPTLLERWPTLAAGERDAFLAMYDGFPGGALGVELATFACDGTRSVEEIAGRLEDEGVRVPAARVAELFDQLEKLGLCAWRAGSR